MDKVKLTPQKINELTTRSRNGEIVKELYDKINEIIDWINTHEEAN